MDDLDCALACELISAEADGEATADECRRVEHHVASCASCAAFRSRAADVDRAIRFRPAEPIPNLVDSILVRARPAVLGRGGWLRPALAWVAVVLFAQNVTGLVLGRTDGAEQHLARHLGAFGVALSFGLLYIAWRPHRAYGMLPFAAALIGTMTLSAVIDVFDGNRSALAESTHLAELVGLVLLWMVAGSPGWHGWSEFGRTIRGRTVRRAQR